MSYSYRYLKFSIQTIKLPSKNNVQFSDFIVRYNGSRIDYGQATATWTNGGAIDSASQTSYGIDNNLNTVFNAAGSTVGNGDYIVDFGFPQTFDHYDYYAGRNSPNDSPVAWNLYVSNDNVNYILVDSININPTLLPTANTPTLVGPNAGYPLGFLATLPGPTGANGGATGMAGATGVNGSTSEVPCFKEGSLILTDRGYRQVQELRAGDLVQTFRDGLVPIVMIGVRDIDHQGAVERIKDQLYVCPVGKDFPEVFEDLILTGCHSLLVESFLNNEEVEKVKEVLGGLYATDDLYRIPACVDMRAVVYPCVGVYKIYHLALENTDYYMNYGIYANGLLVESCSQRYIKELSGMTLL